MWLSQTIVPKDIDRAQQLYPIDKQKETLYGLGDEWYVYVLDMFIQVCVAAAGRAFFLRIAIFVRAWARVLLCSDSTALHAPFDAAAPEKMRAQKNYSDSMQLKVEQK